MELKESSQQFNLGHYRFSRSLAMEVGEYGITVNCVAPGLTVTTPVKRVMTASMIEGQRALRAIQRDEQPEDLAGPVFFWLHPRLIL